MHPVAQPSPSLTPSSQSSVSITLLSPQTGTQVEGNEVLPPVQDQPSTFAVHRLLHLDSPLVSPSSQNSVPST